MVTLGFSDKDFPLNKQVGFTKGSYGYRADGKIFNNKTSGDDFGPKFEVFDTIGCGILPA
jgi:hypothetical protein